MANKKICFLSIGWDIKHKDNGLTVNGNEVSRLLHNVWFLKLSDRYSLNDICKPNKQRKESVYSASLASDLYIYYT